MFVVVGLINKGGVIIDVGFGVRRFCYDFDLEYLVGEIVVIEGEFESFFFG